MSELKQISIFTDVSLNPQEKKGIGAMFFLEGDISRLSLNQVDAFQIYSKIKFNSYENTSSTKLEVDTLLWALENYEKEYDYINYELTIFTDSQCITGLLDRKDRLISNNYISKGSGKEHKNSKLYQKFFNLHEKINFKIIKVQGHQKSEFHDTKTRIFSIIDREVRRKFKEI